MVQHPRMMALRLAIALALGGLAIMAWSAGYRFGTDLAGHAGPATGAMR